MSSVETTRCTSFERFAGVCAILVGTTGFFYSVAFTIIARRLQELGALLSALFLMLGGFLSTPVLVAIYHRLRPTEAGFALWALLLGIISAFGSAVHGGYDLANVINPPAAIPADLPSQIDPRALLTFGLAGVTVFVVAWLIRRGGRFPRGLSSLGYLLAVLLVVLYLARLIVLSPASPVILVPALLAGFLVNPAWYIWLGLALWHGKS